MNNEALLHWLKDKIAEAETTVRAREEAEKTFRSGSDQDWATAANMHPSTAGQTMTKAMRDKAAESQARILAKCRLDLEMLNAAYSQIQSISNQQCATNAKTPQI